jgi:hypothetical protein
MSESAFLIGGITFVATSVAFAVWATVRLINSRKQSRCFWAAVIVAELLVLYPLCFLPACWLSSRLQPSGRAVSAIYHPVIWAIDTSQGTIHIRMVHQILKGCPEGTILTGRRQEHSLAFSVPGNIPAPNPAVPVQPQ